MSPSSSGKNIRIMVSKFSNVTSYQNIKEEEFWFPFSACPRQSVPEMSLKLESKCLVNAWHMGIVALKENHALVTSSD